MDETDHDFEAFYLHFLQSHTRPITRWMHVGAITAGTLGVATALATRRVLPAMVGIAAAVGLAAGAHPLFEGNVPQNAGRPLLAARALLRMCFRQVTGAIDEDIVASQRASEAGAEV